MNRPYHKAMFQLAAAGMLSSWCLGAAAAETDPIPTTDTEPKSQADKMAEAKAEDDACFTPLEPVVSLTYGSRYTDESETRSDFDEESNAEVEKALGPIDDFIGELAKYSNRAISRNDERATVAADCVLDRILPWAEVDALSDLQTETAGISVPGRLAGIAYAYANALPAASENAERREVIEGWLHSRAEDTMDFFDTKAPKRAASNNLRAWAGLAVARVGLTLDDEKMQDWGAETVRLIVCSANEDGSLPREMERGRLALHYHIHALGPLVITSALLHDPERDLFAECDNALPRAVDFMLAALKDPEIVEKHADAVQSFSDPEPEVVEGFELAWAVPYLRFVENDDLKDLIKPFDLLANSKMGGDLTLLWDKTDAKEDAKENGDASDDDGAVAVP